MKQIPWATLRVRLTIWNTLAVFIMTLTALIAVRFGARAALFREADIVLRGEVRETAMALNDLYPDINAVVSELRRKAVGHEERGWFAQLLKDDGTTIWKSEGCPDSVARWPIDKAKLENLVQIGSHRFARRRITDLADEPYYVRIGMPTTFLEDDVAALSEFLIPVGVVLLLVTPIIGYWLALRATTPVAKMLAQAEQLKPTQLGDRLEVRGTADELDRLASTINRLLDQVAGYVGKQQQFVADAAHELRGPLAAMRSALEAALARDRSAADIADTLVDMLDENRHLSRITNDLLLLAEMGDAQPDTACERVDLTLIARQAAVMFNGVAEERRVAIDIEASGPMFIQGNEARLRQVMGNLFDNALRFTPADGRIMARVGGGPRPGTVAFTITDTGCGIAPEHIERVFDRFYKVDAARSRTEHTRGGGLGLAICKSIVERSGGSISIASQVGRGTTVTVIFPSAIRS